MLKFWEYFRQNPHLPLWKFLWSYYARFVSPVYRNYYALFVSLLVHFYALFLSLLIHIIYALFVSLLVHFFMLCLCHFLYISLCIVCVILAHFLCLVCVTACTYVFHNVVKQYAWADTIVRNLCMSLHNFPKGIVIIIHVFFIELYPYLYSIALDTNTNSVSIQKCRMMSA